MIRCNGTLPGNSWSRRRRNFRNSWCRCRLWHSPTTLPCNVSSAANRVVVSVAFVIVGHCAATPLLDWQPGLGAVQSLNLAFFVDAENDCLLRRIQVQTHDIGHLLQKLRIARQLEGFRAMWPKLVSAPDNAHCGLAEPLTLGRAAAPAPG